MNMRLGLGALLALVAARGLAIPTPEWFSSGVVYQIALRTMTPEGTFAAATEKLDHIKSIGANIVYLTPFVEMDRDEDRSGWSYRQKKSGFNSPKNPYRISDYNRVDPEYGTEADAKRFVAKAHALGLKVMFDLVYAHAGPNNTITNTVPDAFARQADGSIKTTEWHFPLINFESQPTRDFLLDNMKRFVTEYDVDGFRCDVGDLVPEDFWAWSFAEIRKLKPDFVGINEGVKTDHMRRAFNAHYDWNWSYALREAVQNKPGRVPLAERIKNELRHRADCPADACYLVFVENHDNSTDAGAKRIDAQLPVEAVNAAYAGIFLSRSVPLIWNGNEFADGAPVTFFAPVEHPQRVAMSVHWNLAETPRAQKRLAALRELARLRRETPALARGTMTFLDNSAPDRVLTFARETPGQRVVVAINLSAEPIEIVCDGKTLNLAPWAYVIR